MADKAVSALTAATTLDGTELFPATQGANSRKVTGAQIVALANILPAPVVVSTTSTLTSANYGVITYADTAAITLTLPTAPATNETLRIYNGSAGTITVNGLSLTSGKDITFVSVSSAWKRFEPLSSGSGGGLTLASKVTRFTTAGSNTWTKDPLAVAVDMICVGGAGGGGSGASKATSSARGGGGGGSGGHRCQARYLASDLPATLTAFVGSGGAGGTAAASGADGSNGSFGGNSRVGPSDATAYCLGLGGTIGFGGSTAGGNAASPGTPGQISMFTPSVGGNGAIGNGGDSPTANVNTQNAAGTGSGGGGGGAAAASTTSSTGGHGSFNNNGGAAGAAGGVGTLSFYGNTVASPVDGGGGGGGGGGGYLTGAVGRAGGAGGGYGAGGGGGSASDTGFVSGAGGAGTSGYIVFIEHY